MFSAFSTNVQARAITLDAVRMATDLEWTQVDFAAPEIPSVPGVYVWVDAMAPHALRYHGCAQGAAGLHRRLSNQLRWRADHLIRQAEVSSLGEQAAYDLSREVPAVQQAAGDDRLLFVAVAKPASWSISRNVIAPPCKAREWESFISALSLHVAGHRGLIGGGAWESKANTLDALMTDLAWDRLADVSNGTWV